MRAPLCSSIAVGSDRGPMKQVIDAREGQATLCATRWRMPASTPSDGSGEILGTLWIVIWFSEQLDQDQVRECASNIHSQQKSSSWRNFPKS